MAKKIIFTDEQIEYMIQNYTSHNKTTQQLAEEFECHRSTIERRLKESGVLLKQFYKHEDLIGKKYGKLLVLSSDDARYKKDLLKTNKPHRYWKCLCDCGNIIEVEGSHLKSGHTISCGCIKSMGEQKIAKLLQENNILFTREFYFNDLKGYKNGLLRFDFAILDENKNVKYLIEYNGKQHYQLTNGWNNTNEYQMRTYNDNKKKDYCKEHNLPLIVIPYTHFDKISIKDLLLTSQFLE